jgi:hypothetical protein
MSQKLNGFRIAGWILLVVGILTYATLRELPVDVFSPLNIGAVLALVAGMGLVLYARVVGPRP